MLIPYILPLLLIAIGASQLSIRLELRKLQGWWQTDLPLDECKEKLIHRLTSQGYQFQKAEKRLVFSKGSKRSIAVQFKKQDGATTFSVIASPRSYSDVRHIRSLFGAKRIGDNPHPSSVRLLPYGLLTAFGVLLVVVQLGSSDTPPSVRADRAALDTQPKLELVAQNAERGYSYLTVEGMVKNISGEPMENVAAVAVLTDANGQYITSQESLIEYDPILAGQSSPFRVMVRDNPAIDKWRVEFKEFFGGTIPHRVAASADN